MSYQNQFDCFDNIANYENNLNETSDYLTTVNLNKVLNGSKDIQSLRHLFKSNRRIKSLKVFIKKLKKIIKSDKIEENTELLENNPELLGSDPVMLNIYRNSGINLMLTMVFLFMNVKEKKKLFNIVKKINERKIKKYIEAKKISLIKDLIKKISIDLKHKISDEYTINELVKAIKCIYIDKVESSIEVNKNRMSANINEFTIFNECMDFNKLISKSKNGNYHINDANKIYAYDKFGTYESEDIKEQFICERCNEIFMDKFNKYDLEDIKEQFICDRCNEVVMEKLLLLIDQKSNEIDFYNEFAPDDAEDKNFYNEKDKYFNLYKPEKLIEFDIKDKEIYKNAKISIPFQLIKYFTFYLETDRFNTNLYILNSMLKKIPRSKLLKYKNSDFFFN